MSLLVLKAQCGKLRSLKFVKKCVSMSPVSSATTHNMVKTKHENGKTRKTLEGSKHVAAGYKTKTSVPVESVASNTITNISDTDNQTTPGGTATNSVTNAHSANEMVTIFHSDNQKMVHLKVLDLIEISNSQREPVENVEPVYPLEWKPVPKLSIKELVGVYGRLSKLRLTGLVVITTMGGYALAPGAFDLVTFGLCSLGTGLTSASANTWNQVFEVPFDAQMNRTKNRPIVTGLVTPPHAVGFAVASGITGLLILYTCVNPLTAALGLFNLGLYTLVYTPMKRRSIVNTWVGSVVGAIPPMMGWAACTAALDPGALLLGAILFSWQFPHFNSLSWNLRPDYSRAGYRMMSVVDPALCKRVALRHSVGLVGLCTLAPVLDVTSWIFPVLSLPLNGYQAYLAYEFYTNGDSASSRKLFRFTLIHIPLIMLLMILDKKRKPIEGKSDSDT